MNVLIAGGGANGKESGVINKIKEALSKCAEGKYTVYNGTLPTDISGNDLVLWMPDISNDEEKNYPVKDKGAVLICSKVMREGYTKLDAVTRIFRMHGNAVIAIYKQPNYPFEFELIDALANIWYRGYDIDKLCLKITALYDWSKAAIRKSVPKAYGLEPVKITPIDDFISINHNLAYKVAAQCGNRFFGNLSTRCTKLFPSRRDGEVIAMSPRNADKRTLTTDDMIQIIDGRYIGDRKPSVDAPVQLAVYETMPEINFMIHGHATILAGPTTNAYYPCGDMREVPETVGLLKKGHNAINLRNHGFLLATKTLDEMAILEETLNFGKIYDF